jgi:hypothetical protein
MTHPETKRFNEMILKLRLIGFDVINRCSEDIIRLRAIMHFRQYLVLEREKECIIGVLVLRSK